jgi:hypothetical protein
MDSSIDRMSGRKTCLKRALVIGTVVLCAGSFVLRGQEKVLVIKGGRIHTVTQGLIENGVISIRNGIIEEIGPDVAIPPEAKILDFSDKYILPGIVSPHSYLGIPPPSAAEQSAAARSGPNILNLAHYPVLYSVYPENPVYRLALKNGVTTMAISPRPSGIAGLGAVIRPGGEALEDILVEERAFLKVNVYVNTLFWDMLKRELEGAQKKKEELEKKAEEKKKEREKDKKKGKDDKTTETDQEEERIKDSTRVFMEVVEGRLPMMADCYSPGALSHLTALLSGFPKVKLIVVGGPEIYRVGALLKERNIPVILSPEIRTVMRWSRAERTNYVLKCQGLGLKMAFQTPGGIQEQIHLFDYLNKLAIFGVEKDVLLRGVTMVPAEILGLDKTVGSLEKGKRADLIVFQDDPLANIPVVEKILCGGKWVE